MFNNNNNNNNNNTKTKETNQITECGNKASSSKGHRRMDTTCMERCFMRNHPKVFKSYAFTTALDGDEDAQIQCFKPEEIVAILGYMLKRLQLKC